LERSQYPPSFDIRYTYSTDLSPEEEAEGERWRDKAIGCTDPVPILTSSSNSSSSVSSRRRCRVSSDCSHRGEEGEGEEEEECAAPDVRGLLRLTVLQPEGDEKAKVLLWAGPREEVLEQGAWD